MSAYLHNGFLQCIPKRFRMLLITGLCLLAGGLAASEVPLNVARTVASNAWYEQNISFSTNPLTSFSLGDPFIIMDGNKPACYIFNVSGSRGFVIIAADDRVTPLLGYSFTGGYHNGLQPPAWQWFMNQIVRQIHDIRVKDIPAKARTKAEWERFQTRSNIPLKSAMGVKPLVPVAWNQGCFYNDSCPATTALYYCYHAVTGCGPTAMSQIMRYWKYPPHGLGEKSYILPGYGTIHANFADTHYNYDSMPSSLNWHGNVEVPRLMYHCGVAAGAAYSSTATGTDQDGVLWALQNYFCYSTTAVWKSRNNEDTTQWVADLRTELDAGRPLLYVGTDASVGPHFFVCDGYYNQAYFHFNWGWGGDMNGFFYLYWLEPSPYNFTADQAAVFNLFPAGLPEAGWDTVGKPAFTPTAPQMVNFKLSPAFEPYVAYTLIQTDSVYVQKFNGMSWVNVGQPVFCYPENCSLSFGSDNAPWLLYSDSQYWPKLARFDGENWNVVGSGDLIRYADQMDLVLDSRNKPYISLVDFTSHFTGYVYSLDNGVWTRLGNAAFNGTNQTVEWTRIAVDTLGHVYVLWTDGSDIMHANVSVFDGTSWSILSGGIVDTLSTDVSKSIAIGEGTKVYVCISDEYRTSKVFRYDDPTWHLLNWNHDSVAAIHPDLFADNAGNVFMGFIDLNRGNRGSVIKYSNGQWTYEGSRGFTMGSTDFGRTAVSGDGYIYFAYTDNINYGKVTVQRYKDKQLGIPQVNPPDNTVVIYPNPCHDGKMFIRCKDGGSLDYTIFDMLGRTVGGGTVRSLPGSPGEWITFSSMLKGIFLVELKSPDHTITQKLVLQ